MTDKKVHTMIEPSAAEQTSNKIADKSIDPSLKFESVDHIFHAYPPVVVADPADMPWGYIRGPKIERLPNGKWICMFLTGGDTEPGPENHAMVATSLDEGRTWQKPVVLFKSNLRRCVPTAYYTMNGRMGVFVSTMTNNTYYLEQRTHLSWYDEKNDTWSVPALLQGCPSAFAMRGFQASNGTTVFPVCWAEGCDQIRPGDLGHEPPQWSSDWGLSETKREYRHVCGIFTSTDKGRTFRVRGYVSHPDINLWEPTATETAPGHFVMLMRAEGTGWLYRSESRDYGENWTPAEATDIPDPSTKPTFLKIGNSILLFHNPNEGIGFLQRKQVEVSISHDGLKTWARKVPLANAHRSDRPICYPDPIYLPETHEIAVVLDTARRVHLQRIPCADLGIPQP